MKRRIKVALIIAIVAFGIASLFYGWVNPVAVIALAFLSIIVVSAAGNERKWSSSESVTQAGVVATVTHASVDCSTGSGIDC